MKVAIFTDAYIPDINGVATSSFILRNELIRLGHEVIVVTTELPSDSDYRDPEGDNILRLPGLELKALYGYRACSVYSFKGMQELKHMNIDVIHVQTEFGIGIFGRIAGETLNVPVVYTYHTMYEDYSHYVNPTHSGTIDNVVKKAIGRLSRLYSDNCTELIVPSLKTKETLEKYGLEKEKINIIPTGLELQKFNPENKNQELIDSLIHQFHLEDKYIITFLGRIAPEKSIELVIDSMTKVIQVKDNAVLLIVGGGPQLDELKEHVIQANMQDHVIFAGPQGADYVPSFYHLSNFFVSASLSETQGLTYIEAMASGIPVVARHDEQLEGVIKDGYNGFFFSEEDQLPDLLLKTIDMDLTELSSHALETAQSFSSEVFAKKVLEVYQAAIQEKHYTYTLKQIIPSKGNKNEVVFEIDGSDVSLELTDKIIDEYHLGREQTIDRELFDVLKDFEQVSRAYNKALRYLTYKDYTYHQMRKKLFNAGDWDDTQLDAVMELLVEKNLINDELYTMTYLKRCMRLGIGINKAIYNLRGYGIEPELIDLCLEEMNDDEEYEAAVQLINTYYHRNSNFSSYKSAINKVKQKLFIKGFSNDTIERAMNDYDFAYDDSVELQALEKEYQKVYHRYSKKLSGVELRNKLIDTLLKKGYNYDNIKTILSKGEF